MFPIQIFATPVSSKLYRLFWTHYLKTGAHIWSAVQSVLDFMLNVFFWFLTTGMCLLWLALFLPHYRRAIKRTTQLYCPFLNKCIITKKNRRQCQACRLRKCQAIGMRQESRPPPQYSIYICIFILCPRSHVIVGVTSLIYAPVLPW